jgi:glutamate synthase domain-containing protein 3
MTGGRVVVLGSTGRNFAAGMSGGVAYVLDDKGGFSANINKSMVHVETLDDPAEVAELRALIEKHRTYTKSDRAQQVLDAWDKMLPKFVKIIPKDYKRMLAGIKRAEEQGLTGDDAIMVAFEENSRDASRVGGG